MDFMQILQIFLCISYKVIKSSFDNATMPPKRDIPSIFSVQQSCHGTTLWEANGAHGIHRSNTWQRCRDGVVVSLPPWDQHETPQREKWHQQNLFEMEVTEVLKIFNKHLKLCACLKVTWAPPPWQM